MTKYFDDMWLALDKELTHFDNYLTDKDWMGSSNTPNSPSGDPAQDINTPNISPQTYESLLSTQDAPSPSSDQLRSKSRAERIEAVRQFYNKMPTIINASSFARLHSVASKLYRTGHVKTANKLMAGEQAWVSGETTYIEDEPDFLKSLEIKRQDGKHLVHASVEDKVTGITYEQTFDSVLDAAKFLRNYQKVDK